MNRLPGDWDCRSCQNLNFRSRESCNRCGEPKIGGRVGSKGPADVKPGDWYCICGTHNFASRSNCFTCGTCKTSCAPFDPFAFAAMPAGWKTGDWICTMPGCNEHNYASRNECFRCKTPREYV